MRISTFLKGRKAVFSALAFLFILAGGGVFAAYEGYNIVPLPKAARDTIDSFVASSPLPTPPRIILKNMVSAMLGVNTAYQSFNFLLETEDSYTSEGFSLDITVEGPVDFDGKIKDSEAIISFDYKAGLDVFGGKISLKLIGEDIYIKVNEITGLPQAEDVMPILANTWIRIDLTDISALYGLTFDTQALDYQKTPKQIWQELGENLESGTVGKLENLGLETVDSSVSHKLRVVLDREGIVEMLGFINEDLSLSLTSSDINEAADAISSAVILLWVDETKFFVRKFVIAAEVDSSKSSNSATDVFGANLNSSGTLGITVGLSKFNEEFKIVPPFGSIDLMEFLQDNGLNDLLMNSSLESDSSQTTF